MRRAALVTIAAAGIALQLPAAARAALPPDREDPCSASGRNTCGTLGVGFYRAAAPGRRWFGDYRGAVPGHAHAFCIDARFWYAAARYDYRPRPALGLRNRDGAVVSLGSQERLAYAIWAFGRTTSPDRQAAVMLYTHALMGDVSRTEVDPAPLGPRVAAAYAQVAAAAERYHGPYRIEAGLPKRLTVGRPGTVTVRVLAASGAAVPGVRVVLAGTGAGALPGRISTGGAGVARLTVVPTSAAGLRLRVSAVSLASTRPRIYAPTAGAAAVNGQRLAVPSSQQVTRVLAVNRVRVAPRLATRVSLQRTGPGARITDRVAVTGLGGLRVRIVAHLFGPFATRSSITCTGTPSWSGSLVASGDGRYETAAVRLDRAGFYTFREAIAARPGVSATTSACGEAAETTLVRARPDVTTVSTDVARPGSRYTERLRVRGLGKTPTTMTVELYGPFASSSHVACTGAPRWTASVAVGGSGEYRAPAVALRKPGIYLFRHRVTGTPAISTFATPCAPTTQTLVVAPRILTGRGDRARAVPARAAVPSRTPVRLRLARIGIDAPVAPVGIDLARGVLAIPGEIARLGWWRDGSGPAGGSGAVLVAGHVDGAHAGIGALFPLRRAVVGDLIDVTTADEATHGYRIVSVRTYPKNRLPLSVYSRRGPPRLVVVTCGGTFDRVNGHYPDNIVVTARPL